MDEWNDDERKRLGMLEQEITLLINPNETDHREMVETIRTMMHSLDIGLDAAERFGSAREKITVLGQKIFKTEWDRIKADIAKP